MFSCPVVGCYRMFGPFLCRDFINLDYVSLLFDYTLYIIVCTIPDLTIKDI